MDFEKFVQPLTDFLTLSISFWTGNFSTFDQFIGLESVAPNALLMSLVGNAVYLIFLNTKSSLAPDNADTKTFSKDDVTPNAVILFLMLGLATPILIETSFFLFGARSQFSLQSVATTFNACLLYSAIVLPFAGAISRVTLILLRASVMGGLIAKFSGIVIWLLQLMNLLVGIYVLRLIPYLHGVPVKDLLLPLFTSFVIFLVIVVPFILIAVLQNPAAQPENK